MQQPLLHINQLNLGYPGKPVLKGLCWTIRRGENWLLTGESGSGKSTLGKAIAGVLQQGSAIAVHYNEESRLPAHCLYVSQWHKFSNHEGLKNFYYQQRYNSFDSADAKTATNEVRDFLARYGVEAAIKPVFDALGLSELVDEPVVRLSSGEHKKLQLARALLLKPQLLVLDNPYTGLDTTTRASLNDLLNDVSRAGVQLIIISNDDEEPSCINRYAVLSKGKLEVNSSKPETTSMEVQDQEILLPAFLSEAAGDFSDPVLELENIHVSYQGKPILEDINWKVNKGERWLLQGNNGSGKSTLLSLITGDNPQAYANTVRIFGRKRGSGESIWDIKKPIGMISPELHWYFDPSATVFQTVASGLFDTMGLFRALSVAQQERIYEMLRFMNLHADKNQLLTTLPLGRQRLCLLARAMIKNPALLILDEPCQGMDNAQTHTFNNLVDRLCHEQATLIYVSHFETRLPNCLTHRLVLEQGKEKLKEELTAITI